MMPHSTDNSAYAARLITHGPFKIWFWIGAILSVESCRSLMLCLVAG